MINLAMLISNPFRPDSRMLKQATSMAARGYQVSIVGWDRKNELDAEQMLPGGIHIIRIQDAPSDYGIGARQMLRLGGYWRSVVPVLNRLNPDLIHCADFDTLPIGLFWGKLHHVPVIYDAREYYADLVRPRLRGLAGGLLYQMIRILEPLAARSASAVITVDETLGAIFRKYNHKVVIAGHYPNLEMASQAARIFTSTELKLIYAGRLSVDRGELVYAQILRSLHEKGIPARLIVAGSFTPATEEDSFRIAILGLEPFVEFAGWVPYDQMPGLLRSADIGLAILQPIPRYVAALPVKLFEYMAAGLPVIASRFPAIDSLLSETKAGMVVDPTRPEEAVECILDWWRNPHKAREAGEHGRRAIIDRYNWESLVDRLDQLYRSLLI